MDYDLLRLVNGLAGHFQTLDDLVEALAELLPLAFAAFVALAALLPGAPGARRAGVVLGALSGVLVLLISQPIAHAVDRLRPNDAHPGGVNLAIEPSHDPSFPSDHAGAAFAIAVGIMLYDRALGIFALICAGAIGLSRIYVGTHYPGDVLAGGALGALIALALYFSPARRPLERMTAWCTRRWDALLPSWRPRRSA